MTNREKFIEVFGDNPQRHHITKSWWDEEYVPLQEPKWISVNDALPEKNDDVLVTDGEDVFIGWYAYDWDSNDSRFCPDLCSIKAWMPLPEHYKAESEVTE